MKKSTKYHFIQKKMITLLANTKNNNRKTIFQASYKLKDTQQVPKTIKERR